jgi:hypothetical protein
VPNMTNYLTSLAAATARLSSDTDPDGPAAQETLLLAAHAGIAQDTAMSADWDLYTVAIADAVERLREDLAEQVVPAALPVPGPDGDQLRQQVTDTVRRLANLYGTAAAGETGPPWRRLVWAQVAHRLDDAVAELT